jgi:quercetin dioxygenase-like cupin family protein
MAYPKIKIAHVHNLFTRMMVFENAGDVEVEHHHQFDHATLVAHGSVLVKVRGKETLFKAPQLIWIARDLMHELVAQEAGTVCVCLHATEGMKRNPLPLSPEVLAEAAESDIVTSDMIPAGAEVSFHKYHQPFTEQP